MAQVKSSQNRCNGLDVDVYVRKSYKFAYSDFIEMGLVASLPESPDPNELYPRQSRRQIGTWGHACTDFSFSKLVSLPFLLPVHLASSLFALEFITGPVLDDARLVNQLCENPKVMLFHATCQLQESKVGTSYVNNCFVVVCSGSVLESQGCESSESISENQQEMDLNLAMMFQEKLISDPRITSILKKRARQIDHDLTALRQDKGLDPNFAMMLKENGWDPKILALLQRSNLDADRDYCVLPLSKIVFLIIFDHFLIVSFFT
ncbi:hypothetical protein AgCh_014109 [Apium graveolens]